MEWVDKIKPWQRRDTPQPKSGTLVPSHQAYLNKDETLKVRGPMVNCLSQCNNRCSGKAHITQTSTTVKKTSWAHVKSPKAIVDHLVVVAKDLDQRLKLTKGTASSVVCNLLESISLK
jgi:hypothetical protein